MKQLVTTNLEIAKQIEDNKTLIAQNEANIEQLYRENEELAVLKTDNETFIAQVEGILAE